MRYKQFGKTGMQVSEMALGTWGIGGVGWDHHSEDTRVDAIHAAIEAGVNFIDTAPAYNAGEAERVLGKTLKDMGVRKRSSFPPNAAMFLSTAPPMSAMAPGHGS